MAQTVRAIMTPDPVALPATASAREAAQHMQESDIGDVIVLDDEQRVCGIVTDRDLALRVVAEGRSPGEVRLGDICSREPVTLSPDDPLERAITLMTENAVRRLPVVDAGRPAGIISLGDLAAERDPRSALGSISGAPPNN